VEIRREVTRHANLEQTLFRRLTGEGAGVAEDPAAEIEALEQEIERLRAKLDAIEAMPSLDRDAFVAATTHTRLICRTRGYAFAEVDAPPPPVGARVAIDGEPFVVWSMRPSVLDRRRCAVVVPAGEASPRA
jgi:hypothetical protein